MWTTEETANLILAEVMEIERRTSVLRSQIADLKVRMTTTEQQMRRQVWQLTAIDERFAGLDERLARIERRVEARI